jgi:hypothetical protein
MVGVFFFWENCNVMLKWYNKSRHGACFNTSTGEVENAPALDKLQAFEVVIKDGIPYVSADPAALRTGREVPGIPCSIKSDEQVIIVGGGSGATGAIEGIREKGLQAKVTVLSKESYLPIDRVRCRRRFGECV